MTTISIASLNDLEALLGLTKRCIEGMCKLGIDQWDDAYPSRADIESDIEQGTLFVLRDAGQIAGSLVLNAFQDPEYESVAWKFLLNPVAVIHPLMIDPTVQGKGFARALMAFAESKAADLGYQTLRLDAFSSNPRALGLYESLGYREAGFVSFRKGRFHCFEKSIEASMSDQIEPKAP